jgi:hypothetical protein
MDSFFRLLPLTLQAGCVSTQLLQVERIVSLTVAVFLYAHAAGLTDTRLAARIMSSEPAKQMSLAMHALGRFGSAADCASIIDLLLDSSRCLSLYFQSRNGVSLFFR